MITRSYTAAVFVDSSSFRGIGRRQYRRLDPSPRTGLPELGPITGDAEAAPVKPPG